MNKHTPWIIFEMLVFALVGYLLKFGAMDMVKLVFFGAINGFIIGLISSFKRDKLPIDNHRRPFSLDEKSKVILKCNGKCKCGSTENLEIDHIVPLARGGHNGEDNLQLLCGKCNKSKGARFNG